MLRILPFDGTHAKCAAALHKNSYTNAWSRQDFEKYADDTSMVGASALHANQFVGIILTRIACDEAEIFTIAVAPSFQGQGIGKEMLKYILNLLLQSKIKNVYLEVTEDNENAKTIYNQVGFTHVGERLSYYRIEKGGHKKAYIYSKSLV